jgi:hypothetical protein
VQRKQRTGIDQASIMYHSVYSATGAFLKSFLYRVHARCCYSEASHKIVYASFTNLNIGTFVALNLTCFILVIIAASAILYRSNASSHLSDNEAIFLCTYYSPSGLSLTERYIRRRAESESY